MNIKKHSQRVPGLMAAALCASMLLLAQEAHAESNWKGAYTISQIENVGTYSWVRFSGVSDYSDAGCSGGYGYIINNANNGYSEMMRVFIAAYLAGKPVNVKVEPKSSNPLEACRITRIRI